MRRHRAAALAALVVAAVGSSLVPAFADVYSTPGGEAAVGTNGESVHARHLAVSNGGHAATYQGIALNTTGTAMGTYAAASGTGCAKAPYSAVAVSGTGCADAAVASASGTGPAGYNNPSGAPGLVGVSGTGCAKGAYVAASGTGCAEGGYAGVSAGGQGNGGVVGVTGWGNAGGGTASVDADRSVGTGTGAVYDALGSADLYYHSGLNLVESAYQSWVVATAPPPDAASYAQKRAAYALTLPYIAQKTSPDANDLPGTGGVGAQGWVGAPPMDEWAPTSGIDQGTERHCVPASVYTAWRHRGMPSFETLKQEMGTSESNGVTLSTAEAVVRKYYQGPSQPKAERVENPADLIAKAVTAIRTFDQSVIVGVDVQYLAHYNRSDGTPRVGRHALTIMGYYLSRLEQNRSVFLTWNTDGHYDTTRRTMVGGAGAVYVDSAELAVAVTAAPGANILW